MDIGGEVREVECVSFLLFSEWTLRPFDKSARPMLEGRTRTRGNSDVVAMSQGRALWLVSSSAEHRGWKIDANEKLCQ